jgi:hypothetical protein
MPELLHSTETEFETDYALLNATQGNVGNDCAGTFAGSSPGALSAHCGTKFALAHVRAERWSSRPPTDGNWEDIDELPFVAIDGDGPLRISGFDPPGEDHGLDLTGFTTGRVLVSANGRHRYRYSDDVPDLPPEEWLLQFFPEEGRPNPLAGPPRRLSGYAPFSTFDTRSGWNEAVHAWEQSGWHSRLFAAPGFRAVEMGVGCALKPVSARDLASASARFTLSSTRNSLPFPDDPLEIRLEQGDDDPLAALWGSPVANLRNAIDTLRHIQLLLDVRHAGETLLVPNPAPALVWDVEPLAEREIQHVRRQIGYADFRNIAEDIEFAVDWAGAAGLLTTVREMGTRWSMTSREIRGGLDLAATTRGITVSPRLEIEDATDDDSPIVVRPRQG